MKYDSVMVVVVVVLSMMMIIMRTTTNNDDDDSCKVQNLLSDSLALSLNWLLSSSEGLWYVGANLF